MIIRLRASAAGAALAGLLLLTGCASASPAASAPPDTEVFALVDGVAIPAGEARIFLADERSNAIGHFAASGATEGTAFWSTSIDGTTPAKYLGNLALHDAVRVMLEFRTAQQLGVDAPSDFPSLVAAWNQENARRAAAVTAGQAIYGPQRYTLPNYVDYVRSSVVYAAAQELGSSGAVATDSATLQRYYAAHLDLYPAPYDQLAEQVRQAYLADAFAARVDRAVAAARVSKGSAWDALTAPECAAAGTC